MKLALIFLVASREADVFFIQIFLLLVDLLQNQLAEVSAQLLWASVFVHLHQLFYLVRQLHPYFLVLLSQLLVFFLQIDELRVNSLEAVFEFLYFRVVGIKKWRENLLILMQDRVTANGVVEVVVGINWSNIELTVQVSQLLPQSVA